MGELRLRVKLGENEFDAEGSREDVVARFDAWKELLTAAPTPAPAPIRPVPTKVVSGPVTHAGRPVPAGAVGVPEAAIAALAQELGLDPTLVVGAASPSATAPFLHLDPHCWEALKKNTPIKGPGSVSPSALAATMLVLWFEHFSPAVKPKLTEVAGVLGTISITDRNAARAVQNCEWLQYRSGQVLPNPAERSKAVAVAKAFCSKQPVEKIGPNND